MIWRITFSKFSDVLLAFTCASAIANLRTICLAFNILRCLGNSKNGVGKISGRLLLFCCLSKSRMFLTISIALLGFSF